MNTADFQIIARFLDAFGPEAEGHGDPAPGEPFARRLEALLRGDCSAEERRAICVAVDEHRDGTRLLAELIKARRARSASPG